MWRSENISLCQNYFVLTIDCESQKVRLLVFSWITNRYCVQLLSGSRGSLSRSFLSLWDSWEVALPRSTGRFLTNNRIMSRIDIQLYGSRVGGVLLWAARQGPGRAAPPPLQLLSGSPLCWGTHQATCVNAAISRLTSKSFPGLFTAAHDHLVQPRSGTLSMRTTFFYTRLPFTPQLFKRNQFCVFHLKKVSCLTTSISLHTMRSTSCTPYEMQKYQVFIHFLRKAHKVTATETLKTPSIV